MTQLGLKKQVLENIDAIGQSANNIGPEAAVPLSPGNKLAREQLAIIMGKAMNKTAAKKRSPKEMLETALYGKKPSIKGSARTGAKWLGTLGALSGGASHALHGALTAKDGSRAGRRALAHGAAGAAMGAVGGGLEGALLGSGVGTYKKYKYMKRRAAMNKKLLAAALLAGGGAAAAKSMSGKRKKASAGDIHALLLGMRKEAGAASEFSEKALNWGKKYLHNMGGAGGKAERAAASTAASKAQKAEHMASLPATSKKEMNEYLDKARVHRGGAQAATERAEAAEKATRKARLGTAAAGAGLVGAGLAARGIHKSMKAGKAAAKNKAMLGMGAAGLGGLAAGSVLSRK